MVDTKFDWNDISIIPATISNISSRTEINPMINNKLPLFVAPMDTVINTYNYKEFTNNYINICFPRHIKWKEFKNTNCFYSYGLDEIIDIFNNNIELPPKVLIDIANGHMSKLYDISKLIKEKYGTSIELMVGNIANPETYKEFCRIGVDWIRCGIGGGSACFVGDTLVKTKIGPTKISDIKNGDFVLTHNGEYKEVINTISYKTDEDLININGNISTKDHKYYVLDKKYLNIVNDNNINNYAVWLEASKIDINNFLLIELG